MTATSTIRRSITIEVPAAAIASRIADLTQWREWSPWEGHDPALERSYTGEPGAVGSGYAWKGNRKAGAGSMTVTRVEPHEIVIDLVFTAPFRSTSVATFSLAESDGATEVGWTMVSPQNLMARVMRLVIDLDKLVGADFEKGLAALKARAERA